MKHKEVLYYDKSKLIIQFLFLTSGYKVEKEAVNIHVPSFIDNIMKQKLETLSTYMSAYSKYSVQY